jgi:hypothetical protein
MAPDLNAQLETTWTEALGRKVTVEQICETVFSEGGPGEGTELRLEVVEIETRGTKQPFNKHIWQVV